MTLRGRLSSQNNQGNTAYHVAAEHRNQAILEALMDADPEVLLLKNNDGLCPVSIASRNGSYQAYSTIMRTTQGQRSATGLDLAQDLLRSAIASDDVSLLKKIDTNSLPLDQAPASKDTDLYTHPLVRVVVSNSVEVTKYLLNIGCDVAWAARRYETWHMKKSALQCAIENGAFKTAVHLLKQSVFY